MIEYKHQTDTGCCIISMYGKGRRPMVSVYGINVGPPILQTFTTEEFAKQLLNFWHHMGYSVEEVRLNG